MLFPESAGGVFKSTGQFTEGPGHVKKRAGG